MTQNQDNDDPLKAVTLAAHFYGLETTKHLTSLYTMVPVSAEKEASETDETIKGIINAAIERIRNSYEA